MSEEREQHENTPGQYSRWSHSIPKAQILTGVFLGFLLSPPALFSLRYLTLLDLPRWLSPTMSALNIAAFLGILLDVISLFGLPILGLLFLFKRARRRYSPFVLSLWLPICVSFVFPDLLRPVLPDLQNAEIRALERTEEKSSPLIQAIEDYKTSKGEYPASLSELVPAFIAEIPYTGVAGHPAYSYRRPGKGDRFSGYTIHVSAAFLMDFNSFCYLPPPNDPEKVLGWKPAGRIGGWSFFDD